MTDADMADGSDKDSLLDIRNRLLRLVAQILGRPAGVEAVPVEGRLNELGMSSIKMVNLMLAVETEFDLTIPQSDITPENFRSVASVESLLARLLHDTAQSDAAPRR